MATGHTLPAGRFPAVRVVIRSTRALEGSPASVYGRPRIMGEPKTLTDEAFVARHAPLVRRIAAQVNAQLHGGLERRELEACGQLGLLQARQRFDPERGVNFQTFAYHRIRGEMLEEVRRGGYLSRRAQARVRSAEAVDALTEPLATLVQDKSLRARTQILEDALGKVTAAFTISALGQDPSQHDRPDAEELVDRRRLAERARRAVRELPEQEQLLIEGVYFQGRQMNDVCEDLGLSKSWGSRLHSKVLGKLRDALSE